MVGLEHRDIGTRAGFPAGVAMSSVRKAQGRKNRMRLQDMSGRSLISLLSFIALTSCVPTDEGFCDYGCVLADDWLNEGDGLIGQSAHGSDDTGGESFGFSLVRCASGLSLHVEQDWTYTAPSAGPNRLETKIAELRNQSGLTDTNDFYATLKRAGFEPSVRQLDSDDQSAFKACKKLYPSVDRNWPKKTPEQISQAAENDRRIEEILIGGVRSATDG